MAELLQRFSGNPFSTGVGQKIEQATDPSLSSENWAINMEICDMINDTDEGPRDAVRAIKKRLQQNAGKNFTVVMFTLTVLESCVKNCGKRFHLLVTNKDFVQDLVKLIGPKNDPPAAVQEKVLSLIQSWSEAFRGQTDLQGVVQVYNELKSKGIEFPNSEEESMAPILTPQRSTPIGASVGAVAVAAAATQSLPSSTLHSESPPKASKPLKSTVHANRRALVTPLNLSAEQMAKLKNELDIVQANMKVFNDMLNELTPANEHSDDWELLNDLNATCQSMQTRIVELIEKVANEEVTNELLRINDELNNLFLRYERHAKKRNPQNKLNERTAVSPQISQNEPNEPTLIDFTDDSSVTVTNRLASLQLSGINATANKNVEINSGDHDFDMFAQSRSTPQTGANNLNANKTVIELEKDQDFDEMERWLKNEPTNITTTTATSTDFDRFLAERATAVERQPEISETGQQRNKPKNDQQSLL